MTNPIDYDELRASDPPDDYLEAEAARRESEHSEEIHGGAECDCPTISVPLSTEPPF